MQHRRNGTSHGFTLMDTLVGVFIFVIVGLLVFLVYHNLLRVVRVSSERVAAGSILQEEMEIIRNIAFGSLGLQESIPNGNLEPYKTIERNGETYQVRTIIRNMDDPYDGVLGNELTDVRLPFSATVGNGGLTIVNKGTVYGKVFSNGPVSGDNKGNATDHVWVTEQHTLSGITVGGDAHAHTIQDATVNKDAYYTTISNTTVNGSLHPNSADTPHQDLPISNAQITKWKNEAAAVGSRGSITLGNGDSLTVGPSKINGNISLTGNAVLTVTGTLWVTGTITLRNSSTVQLHSSYSSASGVIISDGKVSIDNTVVACGSEGANTQKKKCNPFSGSYVVFISTDSSLDPANAALDIKNATEFKGILYTNTGLINISNGAQLVEATGYKVRVDNTGAITYGTGIFNLLITSNPTIGDLNPADYKLVEVQVTCQSCEFPTSVSSTTTVAPHGLETSSGKGALLIKVFDAVGQPVSQASVHIVNSLTNPQLDFTDTTNADGMLAIVSAPPSQEAYQISVTKSGYSTDKTYTINDPANPNPLKAHATVIADAITQISFAIDRLSTLNVTTMNPVCVSRGSVDFGLSGAKLIGQSPDILKYSGAHVTNAFGELALTDMEWDTYNLTLNEPTFYLGGSLPSLPMQLSPNSTESLSLILEPQTTNALLVEVVDAVTQQPVAGASVTVAMGGYSRTLLTGEGHWMQTDWSGGPGQGTFVDSTKYYDSSGTFETTNPVGELKLKWNGSSYAPNGYLISSAFDNATSTNFYHLVVRPQGQPIQTGTDPIRIQIASNKDNATWDFLGPDGTVNTYYTPNNQTLNVVHNGDQYIRYRVELMTSNTQFTPNVSDIAISFARECTPSGQTYFNDVATGQNTITVSKIGYANSITTSSLVAGWQNIRITLTPN